MLLLLTLDRLLLMRQVISRIKAGGKLIRIGGNTPADAADIAEFIKLGASFVTISAWGLLRLGQRTFASACRR